MSSGFKDPDLEAFLSELGLERYYEPLIAEEVDFESLKELSDSDLKDLGVPLGPRRKIQSVLRERTPSTQFPANEDQTATHDVAPGNRCSKILEPKENFADVNASGL